MFSWARHEHERGCFCCGALGEQGLVGNNGGCGQYHQSPATNCKHCHHPHIANMLIAMLCTVQHIMHYCHSPPKSLTRTRTLETKTLINPTIDSMRTDCDVWKCECDNAAQFRLWEKMKQITAQCTVSVTLRVCSSGENEVKLGTRETLVTQDQ